MFWKLCTALSFRRIWGLKHCLITFSTKWKIQLKITNLKVYYSQIFNIFLSQQTWASHSHWFYKLQDTEYSIRGHSISETPKAAATCKPWLHPIKNSMLQPPAEKTCPRAQKNHERASLNHIHRVREWLRWEGNSGGHLVHPSWSSKATYSELPRTTCFGPSPGMEPQQLLWPICDSAQPTSQ